MTLDLKYFTSPDTTLKEFFCLVTDGVKRKDEDGKKVLFYTLECIKVKDFKNYEMYPENNLSKAILPTVKVKK